MNDNNEQPVEQVRVSYREMINCLCNLEWIDRDIELDGNILVDSVYDDMLTLWKKKGYAVPEEDNFENSVLILLDDIVKEQLYRRFTELKIDTGRVYNAFIEQYYQ